jgi:LPXTG-site transpeptidase (sortase) family protein
MIIAAVALLALVATDVIENGRGGNSDLETIIGFGEPIKTATPGPPPTPTNEFPPGTTAPVVRLRAPSVEIDAPVVVRGLDATGKMLTPDTSYDTAWYDFSARPGSDGNAVFSGHVDYVNVGPAVFWDLKDLAQGDVIEIDMEDGVTYSYRVIMKQQYDAATAPIDEIVGPTAKQSVTLITCSGTFSSASHQYDKRLIVRAERIHTDPSDASG